MIDSKLSHDFINNCLRIEVINRSLCDSLEESKDLNQEFLSDLKVFLGEHLNYCEKLIEQSNN